MKPIFGTPWEGWEKKLWFNYVSGAGRERSYQHSVVSRLAQLPSNTHFSEKYGDIRVGKNSYPLLSVTVGDIHNGKPNILIIGGVHGYEPSGVEAAIRFIETDATKLTDEFNFVVYPCVSPWSFEHNQRWNAEADDTNREEESPERILLQDSLKKRGVRYALVMDLHETPDSDIHWRCMRASRYGTKIENYWDKIPQGFYVILSADGSGENVNSQLAFGKSIVDSVAKFSPVAPEREVLGKENHGGIILSPASKGLMRATLKEFADLVAVTEVYPDHPDVGHEKAVQAQLAAIHGGLNHARFAL